MSEDPKRVANFLIRGQGIRPYLGEGAYHFTASASSCATARPFPYMRLRLKLSDDEALLGQRWRYNRARSPTFVELAYQPKATNTAPIKTAKDN